MSPNRQQSEGMKDYGVRRFLAVAGIDVEQPEHAEILRDNMEWLQLRRKNVEDSIKWWRDFRQKVFWGIFGFSSLTFATVYLVPQLQEIKWQALFRF